MSSELPVFTETKTMADLSFKFAYKVPDQMENVEEIASALIFIDEISQVIKETYTDNLIYQIDREDIC